MKPILLAIAYALTAQLALGKAEQLQKISKEQLASFNPLPAGVTATITGDASSPVIHIASEGKSKAHVELMTIKNPPVSTAVYALRGEISYSEVAGDGFLEMWSWFGETQSFFSRTLAEGGPLGRLSGHSDWRGFSLPFNAAGAGQTPTKLVINLSLPGKGSVTLRNLWLEQAGSFEELFGGGGKTAWSSDRMIGWIGGIGGGLIGCLGSLLEFLSWRGRARNFVVVTAYVLAGLGAASLGAGIMALATHQAPGVWYGFLLAGVLCVVIFPVRLRRYLQHYRQTELRRIDSLDAVGA